MAVLVAIGNWVLPLLYLGLMIDYGATFFLRTRTAARSPWLAAVVVLHAGLLAVRAVHLGHPPLAGLPEILSAVAWAMAAVYAVVELASRDRRSGLFVLLLVFLLQYTSSLLAPWWLPAPSMAAAAEGVWPRLHLVPALVAYTAFAFAAIYGLMYLVARRDLKDRRFGVFFERLPPLDLLGRMTWQALVIGFVFMTATILTGPLMLAPPSGGDAGGASGTLAAMGQPKILMKIVTGGMAWLIYAAAVVGRLAARWSPVRIAAVAVAGYAVVMAMLLASAFWS